MTVYCANPKCPLGLNAAPIGAPYIEVRTPEYGQIYVSHQIVSGVQYCDHCAREKRFGMESERMKFEAESRRIAAEKVRAREAMQYDAPN